MQPTWWERSQQQKKAAQFWIQDWDDDSGKFLDVHGVVAARRLEMDHVHAKKVWKTKAGAEALREGYKLLGPDG